MLIGKERRYMSSQCATFEQRLPGCTALEMMRMMSQTSSHGRQRVALDAALIAIVEDDPWVRKSLDRLIKAEGFRTATFACAEDFLNTGDHQQTHCLILDLRLPGMNGLELQHYLVTKQERIPIVFVSAHDEPETRLRAMQAGAFAFFSKPVNDEALVNTVRSAIKSP
jgi:FixJ family two-component response regulator